MDTYRTLCWDLGGTLVDTYASVDPTLRQVVLDAGFDIDLFDVSTLTRGTIDSAMTVLANRFDLSRDRFTHAYRRLKASWKQTPPAVMPGALEVMARVSEVGGLNLVVTHRDRTSASVLIEQLGLPVDDMVCAGDGFQRKPAPDLFHAILQRHNLSPDACLAVGDRAIDATAAHAAGLDVALLETPGIPVTYDCRYHITHLTQLLPLIG